MIACYVLTASAAVTVFMPCLWLVSLPLAASAGVTAAYLSNRYGTRNSLLACLVVAGLTLLMGFTLLENLNRALEPFRQRR